MVIKRFSEVTQDSNKNSKVARAKGVVAHVRTVQAALISVDATVTKVHSTFQNPKSSFTSAQVKKVLVAFGKMNRTLSTYVNRSYQGLKIAVHMGLPTAKIASQIEDLMALKAKLAILRAQAAASVGFVAEEDDPDVVQLDETGYAVDDFDPAEDVVPDEPMTDETASEGEIIPSAGDQPEDPKLVNPTANKKKKADEEIPAPGVEEDETPVEEEEEQVPGDGDGEEAADEEDPQNDLGDIDFGGNEIDDAISGEIMDQDDMKELSCDDEPELEQAASVQARKIASSRSTMGGHTSSAEVGEVDLLKSIASELLR